MLTVIYRLSNITTQITFWEIIVIQFVCSSEHRRSLTFELGGLNQASRVGQSFLNTF